jgi:hypothetical protein
VILSPLILSSGQTVVRDPANSANIVSKGLNDAAKQAIAKAARNALYDENREKITW